MDLWECRGIKKANSTSCWPGESFQKSKPTVVTPKDNRESVKGQRNLIFGPENPMKIGLILPGFSAREDDWCIPALLHLVRQLATRAEIHVFALRYPYRKGHYKVYGATVHALGGGPASGLWRPYLLTRGVAAVVGEHRRRPFRSCTLCGLMSLAIWPSRQAACLGFLRLYRCLVGS